MFSPLLFALQMRVTTVSLLGNWQAPLSSLMALMNQAPLVAVLTSHQMWCPAPAPSGAPLPRGLGRALEASTLLGPFLGVSVLPDEGVQNRDPPVAEMFNPRAGAASIKSSISTVHMYSARLHSDLHTLFKAAARTDKEALLTFAATFLAANADRAKMQADPRTVSSLGACVNLAAIMLRMCAPFAEASPKATDPKLVQQFAYLQPGYVACSRLPVSPDDTRMAATASEATDWAPSVAASQPQHPPWPWHFVCECFFLTSRAVQLGLARSFAELDTLLNDVMRIRQDVASLEAARGAWESGPQAALFRQRLDEMQAFVVDSQAEAHQFIAALTEPQLLSDMLAFLRLQARFLVATAGGSVLPNNASPLPSPPPAAFRSLPQAMAENIADVLLGISRHAPQALNGARLEDFMQFLVLFVGAPEHAKNPYLRAKLVDVLRAWMPPPPNEMSPSGSDAGRANAYTRALFEGHPLAVGRLVPHLLTLYVDIEFGGGRTVFYDKMNIRHAIGTLLEYLWQVPDHRATWRALAASTAGDFYLRFVNMLINDAIYQLAEAMKLLPEVRELEEMRADGRFAALPPREQQERGRSGGALQSYLLLACVHLRMMRFTTADGPTCAHPFLLPEMVDRVAAMLNYFLSYLVGPDRGRLRLSPEAAQRYGWEPKAVLTHLCGIYINLHAAGGATFAGAVARDDRSYRDDNFSEASHVLRALSLLPDVECGALEALAEAARAHAAAGAADDEVFSDPPEEFQDMLMAHLMSDPVRLPTGGGLYVVDRATIARHLLSNNTCPFTRAPLSIDQVAADEDLKGRIDAWKRERLSKARGT